MVGASVGGCERSSLGDGAVASEGDALVRGLVAVGIDDLAKYLIVRLLYRSPNTVGDAEFYAANLGLHCVETTAALLEDLVERGVLVKQWPAGAADARFRWADAWEMRRHVMKLYNLAELPGNSARVLRSLAARSLGKARKRGGAMSERREMAALRPVAGGGCQPPA